MPNRIREVRYHIQTLSAAQAEIWFTVVAEQATPATEARGRVVGPRCSSRTTIEVAYPLRRIACPPPDTPLLTVRALIPDPSLWEPDAPFLYRAHVELWQDGQRCDHREFDLGLRLRG